MSLPHRAARMSSCGWLRGALWSAFALVVPLGFLWLSGCVTSVGQTAVVTAKEDCDEEQKSDSLIDYAHKCAVATGEDVPAFNCDNGTEVPEEHLNPAGAAYGSQFCDRPNVLNHVCDPGSRFQVLKQTNDVAIVGHCRKKGLGSGEYGDIAVIQYNQKNGATCFYQALGTLSAKVTAPSEGNGAGKFPWLDPSVTATIGCVHCHDNGPFVRSPYLAQLRNNSPNRLPGTNGGSGRWDQRFSWNQTLPYTFVGNDFQSWKVYSVSVTGTGSGCAGCHRLGLSSIHGKYQVQGTAQVFGPEATAATQAHKNPHAADSPIWMTPGQITYSAANETEAKAVAACAYAIVAKGNDPNAPPPPDGCQATQYGQGDTCRNGSIRAVLNGATQSTPDSGRTDVIIDLGPCSSGDCPLGFCYWRTVHGPFWQMTPGKIPFGAAGYRGSYIRIYSEGGYWKVRVFSDPTGGPPNAAPGGTVECTRFNEIIAIPDPIQCFASQFAITDPDGSHLSSSVDVTVAGTTTVNYLSGLIGNIAQANSVGHQNPPDVLRVDEGNMQLLEKHIATPPSPLKPGPFTGESWTTGCKAWTAEYVVKDAFTTSDVQLVAADQSKRVRCFITGVTGAWSSTRNHATVQPYAEIYLGAAKDTRLHVSPTSEVDRVGAYASCIRLK
jgi:hypothetical protein